MNANSRTWHRLGVALCAGAAGASTHGALLTYEGFAYAPGSALPGLAGGVGWAGPWTGSSQMIASPPTMTHACAPPSTGIRMSNTAVGEAFRNFGGGGLSNVPHELWMSFLEQRPAVGPDNFVHIDPLGAGGPDIVVDNTGGGAVLASVGGGASFFIGASAGPGNPDFVMIHVTQFTGSTSMEFFVNSLAPSASAGPFAAPVSFQQFYWRTDPGIDIDEIRVGTTEGDVAAVPGPGSGLVLALAGMAGLRRRR